MKKFLKILKINLLSLIALPLLVLATISKLIVRSFDKATLLLKMSFVMLIIELIFELIQKPSELFDLVGLVILLFFLAGILFLILSFLISILSAALVTLWSLFIYFFEFIYHICFSGYLHLSEICEKDYEIISLDGKKTANAFLCVFYTILSTCSKLISGIISLSLPCSILLSIGLVIYTITYANQYIKDAFGITILQYLQKFDLVTLIFAGLIYIVFIGSLITILLTLGFEWSEWSKELRMTSSEYMEYMRSIQKEEFEVKQQAENNALISEQDLKYINSIENQIHEVESLSQEIDALQNQRKNAQLQNIWHTYLQELQTITSQFESHNFSIPYDEFHTLIPKIQKLEQQQDEIKELVQRLKKEYENPFAFSIFFHGCDTLDKLDQRYKSLCKTYHPDMNDGDEETFKKMAAEYESLKQSFN